MEPGPGNLATSSIVSFDVNRSVGCRSTLRFAQGERRVYPSNRGSQRIAIQ